MLTPPCTAPKKPRLAAYFSDAGATLRLTGFGTLGFERGARSVGNLRRMAGWHNEVRFEIHRASDGSAFRSAVRRARGPRLGEGPAPIRGLAPPTVPKALSLAANLARNCLTIGTKVWRRERDSNPRRAFDPYTLSRAGPQSTAVYAIMGIGLYIGFHSTAVHGRLR